MNLKEVNPKLVYLGQKEKKTLSTTIAIKLSSLIDNRDFLFRNEILKDLQFCSKNEM